MQDLDSQAENSSKFELTTKYILDTAHIERYSQEKLDRESFTTNNGTDVKDRPNVNVAPFNATRLRDTDNVINDARNNKVAQEYATSYLDMDSGLNVEGQASALKIDPLRRYCVNGVQSESVHPNESLPQFTAEKINNTISHRINKSTSAEQELCLRDNTGQNLFMKEKNEKQCNLEKSPSSNEPNASKIMTQPVLTSTPILMRNEGNNAYTSQSILSVFNRIDQLDSNKKAVKRDIILQMEKKLDDLKSSVVSIIEGVYTDVSYADAVKRTCAANSSTQSPIENSRNASVSRFVDEGFADTTLINVNNSSSETKLKAVATSQNIVQRNSAKINSQQDVERISTQKKSQPAVQRIAC